MKNQKTILWIVAVSTIYVALCVVAKSGEHRSLAAVSLAGETLRADEEVKVKVPRSECKVCNGTGKVKSGDGYVWTECDNCEPTKLANMTKGKLIIHSPGWFYCGPCHRAEQDLSEAGYDVEVRKYISDKEVPGWVKSFPAIQYQGDDGSWYYQIGFSSVEGFEKRYHKTNSTQYQGLLSQTIVQSEEELEDYLNGFLPFSPNKYLTVKGTVDLDGVPKIEEGKVVARLKAPRPVISLSGWIEAEVERVEYDGKEVLVVLDGAPDYTIKLD